MKARWTMPALLALAMVGGAARAELGPVNAGSFTVTLQGSVKADPAAAYAALTRLPQWWNGEHTYSGDASKLSFDAQAGGCWCERWAEGRSVHHATVLMALPGQALRLSGGLGPLQGLPVHAVLTLGIGKPADGRTPVRWTYRVGGPAEAGLDQMAAPVDKVLTEQFQRYLAFVDR